MREFEMKTFEKRLEASRKHYHKVTGTAADETVCRNNKELALFHYFNQNGLRAKKRTINQRINDAVDAGKCKTGAILAYGSLGDDCIFDMLYVLVQKRRVSPIDLNVAVIAIRRSISRAEQFLDSLE